MRLLKIKEGKKKRAGSAGGNESDAKLEIIHSEREKQKKKKSAGAAVHFINKDEIIRAKKEDEDC